MTAATFTAEVKLGILYRDGEQCVLGARGCRGRADPDPHHRLNRGAGGSTDPGINAPANGAAICSGCNWRMEAVAEIREYARRRGVKLEQGEDPETTPMWSPFFRQWIVPASTGALLTGVDDETLDARHATEWMPDGVIA